MNLYWEFTLNLNNLPANELNMAWNLLSLMNTLIG
jgi:hypothetical protein